MAKTPTFQTRSPIRAALSNILGPLSFLFVLMIILAIIEHRQGFLSAENMKNVGEQTAVVAILAVGETAVIISAGIDLSVGSVLALAEVISAQCIVTYGLGRWSGLAVSSFTGLACGLINGLITAFGQIPSFIVTLGMMGVAAGLAGVISHENNIYVLTPGLDIFSIREFLGSPTRNGIPYAILLMLLAAVIVHIVLTRTRWGRNLYAVGGSSEAARLSGISLKKMTVTVFALAGLLAGFAAMISMSRSSIAQPDAGRGYELDAIAATVIGGTSLFGGSGGIPGTIIGAFLMSIIHNGCDLKAVPPSWQQVIIGGVTVAAVLYDRYRRRS